MKFFSLQKHYLSLSLRFDISIAPCFLGGFNSPGLEHRRSLNCRNVARPIDLFRLEPRKRQFRVPSSPRRETTIDSAFATKTTPQPRFPTPTFLATLFAAGATLGPPLDGIHGSFGLLQYDLAPLEIGDSAGALHTSLTVPLLLGTFYAVSGLLHVLGDEFFSSSLPLPLPRRGPALASCALALIAAHLALSALLYVAGVSEKQISLALWPAAFLVWLSLDRTSTGLALALATAAAAPLAELVLMNLFNFWHYPRADLFLTLLGDQKGIVSWVPACYAGYSVWIGALARWLRGGRGGE